MPEKAIDEQVEHGLAGFEGHYFHHKKKKNISIQNLLDDTKKDY